MIVYILLYKKIIFNEIAFYRFALSACQVFVVVVKLHLFFGHTSCHSFPELLSGCYSGATIKKDTSSSCCV